MSLNISVLNQAQYEAVTAKDGQILVIAGAGSGKTRTIVHRLAWLHEQGVRPGSMLLLTFTRKAAAEMLNRAADILGQSLRGVQGGTFHAFAYSVLRHYPPNWAKNSLIIMDQADSEAAVRHCREELKIGKDRGFPNAKAIVSIMSKCRNKEISISELLRNEMPHLMLYAEDMQRIGEACAKYRKEHCLLDYDDLLFELETMLAESDEAAKLFQSRFSHILVDEYQDTNRVQARLVRLLAGKSGNVMVVGDDAQSIYAFRGADIRNILDFKTFFPAARMIRLEENYRSFQPVLDVANSILVTSHEAYSKHLFTRREGGEKVRLIRPLSDLREAEMVAKRIDELLEIYPPKEIAVLFRAGYQSYHLEIALSRKGISFRKYGGLRYTEAAHIKDALAYVRLIVNGLDRLSFARIASLCRGVGPKTAQRVFEALRTGDSIYLEKVRGKHADLAADMDLLDNLHRGNFTPAAALDLIIEHYRPKMEIIFSEDWPKRLQGLEELRHIASAYENMDTFLADVSLESTEEETDEDGAVILSTIHSAKGLEWDVVLMIDLVEERFPSRHALTKAEDFEEERRLMYVACTRAKNVLELYAPQTIYSRSGGMERAVISPFVRDIPENLYEKWQEGYDGRLKLCENNQGVEYEADNIKAENCAASVKTAVAGKVLGADVANILSPVFGTGEISVKNQIKEQGSKYSCGFCRHKIFGRGKIVEHIPPDKCRVNFPGLGLKVILSNFLTME